MDNGGEPLIRLEQVSKVFVTDEVETHALSGIHFDVKKGEYLSIAGPSGPVEDTVQPSPSRAIVPTSVRSRITSVSPKWRA